MDLIKNKTYIRIDELPEHEQMSFKQWLSDNRQTIPRVPQEGKYELDCAYKHDYEKWFSWYYNQNLKI